MGHQSDELEQSSRDHRATNTGTRRARTLAAFVAALLTLTIPAADHAAAAGKSKPTPVPVKAPYTVGVMDPAGDWQGGNYRKTAYLGRTIDVRKTAAGRSSTHLFLRVRIHNLLWPKQLAKRAPFLEQHINLGGSVFISPEEGSLGALLAEVTVSRDGLFLQPRPDPFECAGTRLTADPKRNVITLAAPLTCLGPLGPYGGLTGRPIDIHISAYTQLRPSAPADATPARDGNFPGDLKVPDPAA